MLYVDDVAVGCATSVSLSLSQEMVDATCKSSDGWQDMLPGQRNWTAEVSGLVIYENLFNVKEAAELIVNQTKVTLKFSTEVTGDTRFTGNAYATEFGTEAALEDTATYSLSFQGVGPLTVEAVPLA